MNLFEVIKQYNPDINLFVKINKSEEVEIIKEYNSANWINWVECDYKEKKCYIPKQYLEIKENTGILNRAYDSTELVVEVGMQIDVEFTLNGFAYGRILDANQTGWVPLEVLEFIREPLLGGNR